MVRKILKWLVPYILISATVYPVAKDGLNFSSPFVLMGIRYLLGASVILLITRKLLISKNVIILAVSISLSSLLWILGLEYVSSGDSAVLSYTMPFFAILGASVLLSEKVKTNEIAGSVIGFSGAAVFAIPLYHGLLLAGTLLTVGGAVAWATYTIFLRKLKGENQLSVIGTALLLGSVPFIIGSIPFHALQVTPEFMVDALYLGLVGSVVTIFLLSSMVREEKVGKVTVMVFGVPVATLCIQSVQTLSLPSAVSIVGCGIIFLGMYVANMRR